MTASTPPNVTGVTGPLAQRSIEHQMTNSQEPRPAICGIGTCFDVPSQDDGRSWSAEAGRTPTTWSERQDRHRWEYDDCLVVPETKAGQATRGLDPGPHCGAAP